MTKEEIIAKIWELPWYDVLVIAVKDDGILFVKIWPVYIGIIVIGLLLYFWSKR